MQARVNLKPEEKKKKSKHSTVIATGACVPPFGGNRAGVCVYDEKKTYAELIHTHTQCWGVRVNRGELPLATNGSSPLCSAVPPGDCGGCNMGCRHDLKSVFSRWCADMGFLSFTDVNAGSFDKGEKSWASTAFVLLFFFFCNKTRQAFINTWNWSAVRGTCSVQVEALFHGSSKEALSHDLFRGIFGQFQIVYACVH